MFLFTHTQINSQHMNSGTVKHQNFTRMEAQYSPTYSTVHIWTQRYQR